MARGTERNQKHGFRLRVVVPMRHRQRAAVGVERLTGPAALPTALLTLPPGSVFDGEGDLLPVDRVEVALHGHGTRFPYSSTHSPLPQVDRGSSGAPANSLRNGPFDPIGRLKNRPKPVLSLAHIHSFPWRWVIFGNIPSHIWLAAVCDLLAICVYCLLITSPCVPVCVRR